MNIRLNKIFAFSLATLLTMSSVVPVFAEEELKENSFRYENGENITQQSSGLSTKASSYAWRKKDGTWRAGDGREIPNAISKGIDVSHHDGTINWKTLKEKSDVDYAIIRCGYGQDGVDRQWNNNIAGARKNNMPYGIYIYSYATSLTKATNEANHVLGKIKSYKNDAMFRYPVYYDLEDAPTFGKQSSANRIAMAKKFCTMIENAGYNVGIYANTDWFTNYLPASTFDQWHRWCAEYKNQCNYKRRYDIWQSNSRATVSGVNHVVDVNFTLKSFLGTPKITTASVKDKTVTVKANKYSVSNPTTLDKRFIPKLQTEIQYADNSSFSNPKTVVVNGNGSNSLSKDISLEYGKTYSFRARNKWTTEKGTFYGAYSNTITASIPKPVVVKPLTAKDIQSVTPAITGLSKDFRNVSVFWNKFGNANDKNIGAGSTTIVEYSTNSNFSTKTTKTIAPSNTTNTTGSHTFKNLPFTGNKNTTYYIRIKLSKKDSSGSYFSKYSATKSVTLVYPVATPSISSIKSAKKSQITLNWNKGNYADANTYVEYSTSKNFKTVTKKVIKSSGRKTGSHTFTGLKSGKTYYFRIRLGKAVSGATYYSNYSAAKSVKCK